MCDIIHENFEILWFSGFMPSIFWLLLLPIVMAGSFGSTLMISTMGECLKMSFNSYNPDPATLCHTDFKGTPSNIVWDQKLLESDGSMTYGRTGNIVTLEICNSQRKHAGIYTYCDGDRTNCLHPNNNCSFINLVLFTGKWINNYYSSHKMNSWFHWIAFLMVYHIY